MITSSRLLVVGESLIFNVAVYVGLILLNHLPLAIAQTVPLNGPTPWEVIGNTFSQPNVTMQIGKDSLEWYGSGDLNLDNVIDSLDYAEMLLGNLSDMADINGNGTPSDDNDKQILLSYSSGAIEYLPGHWNELRTPEERENWFSRMYSLTDVLNGTPPGWVCADWINQAVFKHFGLSNYQVAINQGAINPQTNIDSIAKFNLPFYLFAGTNINGIPHAFGGILVGRRVGEDSISYNPLDFKDWSFRSYQHKTRIYPGDWDIDPNHPVIMKLRAYVKNPYNGQNYCNLTGPWIEWSLNNGEPTLTYYWNSNSNGIIIKLLLENPNVIKVDIEDLEDILVDAAGFPENTNWTPDFLEGLGYNGKPDVTTYNTLLNPTMTYIDQDTVWHLDSTGYSFSRYFRAKIYSGGYTKWDTTSHRVTLDNLVSVRGGVDYLPETIMLYQNYPNPFNSRTVIRYELPRYTPNLSIDIYNSLGEKINSLVGGKDPGVHEVIWNGTGQNGIELPSGVYIYKVIAGGSLYLKKMIYIK